MTPEGSTHEGWYVRGNDGTADWQRGPYLWSELVGFARDGRIQPHNLVWHAARPMWQPASAVPGLFAQAAPAPAPAAPAPAAPPVQAPVIPAAAAAPAAAPAATPAPAPARRPRKALKFIAIALVALLAIGALAVGAWALFFRDGATASGPNLGTAECVAPDAATLVTTTEWGEVPASEIVVVLVEGSNRSDAERVASAVGGTIAGEIEFVNLYQVQFPGRTEDELRAAITAAEADEAVDYACPNQEIELREEIWGVRVDPYTQPPYDQAGAGYSAIGVSRAWAYIRGSGADLSPVHVGIVDNGLYNPDEGAMGEFGGDVTINFPNPQAGLLTGPVVRDDGTVDAGGSHGTGVATIIGADSENGGASGIAAPLGSNLTMSITNHDSGSYGSSETTANPDDPTQVVWTNGKSYALGSLVAITEQIEAGATVINCSWGADVADARIAETYRRYFEKMATEHPDVLFVCAAGNSGTALDTRTSFPCGHALPNMITVGAVDDDGKTASYSTVAGDHYEVTLAAPGTDAVVGVAGDGSTVRNSGTSFASPEVAAAAAMIRSIDPDLTAAEIKAILVSTSRTSLPSASDPTKSQTIGAEVGGRVLAIDQAVLKVINDTRAEEGLDPITPEWMEALGVVDGVAVTGDAGQYTVRGIVKAVSEDGASLKITVSGEDYAIGGDTTQALDEAGEVVWDVTLPEDEGTITVERLDTGAKSVITIERLDINGTWTGTFTFTNVTITDEAAAEDEGCSAAFAQALIGLPIPMTLDIMVDESGQGTAVMTLDASAIDEDATSEPQTLGVSYSGHTITFDVSGSEGVSSMSATVSRSGQTLQMKGAMGGGGPGYTISAAFTLSKPYSGQ